jgi:hypothetical protein
MLYLLKEKSRFYHFLKSRCKQTKECCKTFATPGISDYPRYTFANVIQTALVRAIRYSSAFETFTNEQIAVELILLYDGFVLFFA